MPDPSDGCADLRDRVRKHLQTGVVTQTCGGDVERTIDILQSVLATEIV
jgi:bacterioferritin